MYGLSRYMFCSGLRTTYLTRWDGDDFSFENYVKETLINSSAR